MEARAVMNKAFDILKNKTEIMSLKEVIERAKAIEKAVKRGKQ